jgi:sugar phosphate isomerase/epimerase
VTGLPGGFAVAGQAAPACWQDPGMTSIGLMLYTVRRECAEDLQGTLREVAAMGYAGVELFDLHGHPVEQVRGWLEDAGLAVCGRHAGLDAIEGRLPELADEAGVLGSERLVVSWIEPPRSPAGAAAIVERLRAAAEAAAAAGLRLGFHNHDAEVRPIDGEPAILDQLLGLPPELLFLEVDLGWAWFAGVDPVAVLERARGRCPLVHVKDFRTRGERSFAPVGEGAVGYERVARAAVEAGVEWLLVEQDETDGPALDAVRRSLVALRRMLGEPA